MHSKVRKVDRIRLAHPILGRLGPLSVVLVDVSVQGARVEHGGAITVGNKLTLSFEWEHRRVVAEAEVVRCKLERFSVGANAMTIYHSGLVFTSVDEESQSNLRTMIVTHVERALLEQRLNARGALPVNTDKMPIFQRGGLLTQNRSEIASEMTAESALPHRRIARESSYFCFRLVNNTWRRTVVSSSRQPDDGFTIWSHEDPQELEELCQAYYRGDDETRRLIRIMAEMSVTEGGSAPAERFQP